MRYKRHKSNEWAIQELSKIKELYPTCSRGEIMVSFPTRTWRGIVRKAQKLGLQRPRPVKVVRVKVDKKTPLAYLAGFFDGEGSIRIAKAKYRRRISYNLAIDCSNNYRAPIQLFKDTFGGSIRQINGGHNQHICYQWLAHNRIASTALEYLSPFLVVKVERAKLALEFENKVIGSQTILSPHKLSEEDIAVREKYRGVISKINSEFRYR